MKKTIFVLSALIASGGLSATQAESNQKWDDQQLRTDFVTPPDTTRIACYWYWISDHISSEGVAKDLRAMKEEGITRAYIGNIGIGENTGEVKFDTDAWWDAIHTAMKTATELGIELGMFNSPGWSQSGGPWVKPEQAMRYMTSTEKVVQGGDKISITLDKPAGEFDDIKVIAFPVTYNEEKNKIKNITAQPALPDAKTLIDEDKTTGTKLAGDKDGKLTLDLVLNEAKTIRSAKIYANNYSINTMAHLQVKNGDKYTNLADFKLDRYSQELNVGFMPLAPVVIALPATTANEYRLIVDGASDAIGLAEIELSSFPFMERYVEKSLGKMFQEPLPYWHEYQWRTQPTVDDAQYIINPSKVVDISACLSGDTLTWDAPEGSWKIMRIGVTPTGVKNSPASKEATGLEVDKMSRKHIAAHFDAFMGEVIRRIPAEDRKCWKAVVMDSYEMGGQNYTDTLFADFQKKYGYDPIPFLPVLNGLVVESREISDRFLWDLRRLIADKVAYDYIGGLRDVSHKHGLTTWLENYGHWGFPGEFLEYGGQSDEIGGEFWAVGSLGNIENRAASSCGHIYGKRKIYAESFTSGNYKYTDYPAVFKQRGDRFFSEGINSTLLHLYIHQPYEDRQPGVNAWFGSDFQRFNTWFPQLDLFTTYLKRVNYMLQQGLNVADVAYFIGEDIPKMTGITEPALPKGYQFDYINAEVIEKSLTVKNGLLTLPHGTQYKMLVLPPLETMRPELLKKIQKLIEKGAIVLGPAPSRSPSLQNYPQADQEVQQLATKMWSGNEPYKKIGKGMLITATDMKSVLEKIGVVPDLKSDENLPILYGHRTMKKGDIYFVSNQSDKEIVFTPEFRVQGMKPEWWNAISGEIRPLPAYTQTATGTKVPMRLAAYESAFIVFTGKATYDKLPTFVEYNCPEPKKVLEITTPWSLRLVNTFRDFEKTITLKQLENLSKNQDADLKYFSGTAYYSNDFTLDAIPAHKRLCLDLGKVNFMAKVKINGQYVGGVWTPPYRVDITDAVKPGANHVEIEVVNTWANRMIGDMTLPESERKIWAINNAWTANSALQDSGLEGPVVLESINRYNE